MSEDHNNDPSEENPSSLLKPPVDADKKDDDDDDDDDLSYDPGPTQMGCCIFGKYPIISLLSFVALGLAVGIGLSYWRPEVRKVTERNTT